MKKKLSLLLLFFLVPPLYSYRAVTQGLDGSRLGDQLVSYLHGLWIAYKYNIDYFYSPFPYSDQLALHYKTKHFSQMPKNLAHKTLYPGQSLDDFFADDESSPNTLYSIPYFPESLEEHVRPNPPLNVITWARPYYPYFKVDWNDPVFKKLIQEHLAPVKPLNLVRPPHNKISIAIHVRMDNGGYDRPLLHGLNDAQFNPNQLYSDVIFPLKCPPFEYYIEQLKKMISFFPGEQLYVYIFTDDPQPTNVVQKFKTALPLENLEYDCRKAENNHYSNVLEDLFSMTKFDCFIRPDSNLSITASKLGNFRVVISPAHHHWERKLVIDEVAVEKNS